MTKALVMLGAGGHAGVLLDILRQQQREILALVSPEKPQFSGVFYGVTYFSADDDVLQFDPQKVKLVNGIGALPGHHLRAKLYKHFTDLGYEFETVIDSRAMVSCYAQLAAGVQIMAGAIVQTGVKVAANSIINTGAIVDHDCIIGMNNHIAPGVTLSGQVETEQNVHVGTGAAIIQSVSIAKNVVVAAGATITKSVDENMVCFPARITQKVID